MSNVKKGDLAIKIGGPNLGALVQVLEPAGQGAWGLMWHTYPMQDVVRLDGHLLKAGRPGRTYDAWLRPLRGDPPAEVEKIGDTRPSEVEA